MASNGAIGDNFWKPPLLVPGEYEYWTRKMEAHVCSLDGQLWRVIVQGPIAIENKDDATKPKDPKDYTDADFKSMEKNYRAMKVLHQALSPGDEHKVMKYQSAHEIWEALKRLYGGNESIKRNKLLAARESLDNAYQGKTESLEEYHGRFQTLVGQLEFLGKPLETWEIAHKFLQSLDQKWEHIATTLLAQPNVKDQTLEELVPQLQSSGGIHDSIRSKREGNNDKDMVALKVGKDFNESLNDESDEDDGDEITDLVTRAIRMAVAREKRFVPRERTEKRRPANSENRICFHCQQKGHLINDCIRKKRGDPPAQKSSKAMVSAWGDADRDSDEEIGSQAECLMTHANASECLSLC